MTMLMSGLGLCGCPCRWCRVAHRTRKVRVQGDNRISGQEQQADG